MPAVRAALLSSPQADLSSTRVSSLCSLALFRARVAQARSPCRQARLLLARLVRSARQLEVAVAAMAVPSRYRLVIRLPRAVVVVPYPSMVVLGALAVVLSCRRALALRVLVVLYHSLAVLCA